MNDDVLCDNVPIFIVNEDNVHLEQRLIFRSKQELMLNKGITFVNLFLGAHSFVNFPMNGNYKGYIIFHKYGVLTCIIPLNETEIYELKSIKFMYDVTHRHVSNTTYRKTQKTNNIIKHSRFFVFPQS